MMTMQIDGFEWDRGNRAKCQKHGLSIMVFTLRSEGDKVLLRPISARYMHKKEIEAYEKENSDIQE